MSSQPYPQMLRPNDTERSVTLAYDDGKQKAVQCRHKEACPSSTGFTREIVELLRNRLRLAVSIALATSIFFLARNFYLLFSSQEPPASLTLFLHGSLVAILGLAAGFLWSPVAWTMGRLRVLEIGLFTAIAAFFAYLQLAMLHHVREFGLTGGSETAYMLHYATLATGFRWFALIVLYGTFIPNTWKRCAIVVSIMALAPILLTGFVCSQCIVIGPHSGSAVFDLMIILGMGSAIAIFGSHKINVLHQEAYEARRLGQYQLGERLGAGGMGEVYRAKHTLLQRDCAIKLIRPDQAGDPTNMQRFEREVKATAKLTHWNTVEIYDFGHSEDGTFYYVMEYLPGRTIQDLIDEHGPLPPGRAVYLLRQVCAALFEAHEMRLIHRDIKPSNVFICQRGGVYDVAKLLDFGLVQSFSLAKGAEKLTVQGAILGSPPYISPEQALGKETLDARTDVYSVGGLAYFLLAGQPPFVRETAMEMMVAHVHETPVSLRELQPSISSDLEDVVMRCLEKDPNNRFADVNELEEALAACECADAWDRDQARAWWENLGQSEKQVMEDDKVDLPREVVAAH